MDVLKGILNIETDRLRFEHIKYANWKNIQEIVAKLIHKCLQPQSFDIQVFVRARNYHHRQTVPQYHDAPANSANRYAKRYVIDALDELLSCSDSSKESIQKIFSDARSHIEYCVKRKFNWETIMYNHLFPANRKRTALPPPDFDPSAVLKQPSSSTAIQANYPCAPLYDQDVSQVLDFSSLLAPSKTTLPRKPFEELGNVPETSASTSTIATTSSCSVIIAPQKNYPLILGKRKRSVCKTLPSTSTDSSLMRNEVDNTIAVKKARISDNEMESLEVLEEGNAFHENNTINGRQKMVPPVNKFIKSTFFDTTLEDLTPVSTPPPTFYDEAREYLNSIKDERKMDKLTMEEFYKMKNECGTSSSSGDFGYNFMDALMNMKADKFHDDKPPEVELQEQLDAAIQLEEEAEERVAKCAARKEENDSDETEAEIKRLLDSIAKIPLRTFTDDEQMPSTSYDESSDAEDDEQCEDDLIIVEESGGGKLAAKHSPTEEHATVPTQSTHPAGALRDLLSTSTTVPPPPFEMQAIPVPYSSNGQPGIPSQAHMHMLSPPMPHPHNQHARYCMQPTTEVAKATVPRPNNVVPYTANQHAFPRLQNPLIGPNDFNQFNFPNAMPFIIQPQVTVGHQFNQYFHHPAGLVPRPPVYQVYQNPGPGQVNNTAIWPIFEWNSITVANQFNMPPQ